MAYQHEKAVDEEQFGQTFEETATEFPLGEAPALVVGLTIGSPEPMDVRSAKGESVIGVLRVLAALCPV